MAPFKPYTYRTATPSERAAGLTGPFKKSNKRYRHKRGPVPLDEPFTLNEHFPLLTPATRPPAHDEAANDEEDDDSLLGAGEEEGDPPLDEYTPPSPPASDDDDEGPAAGFMCSGPGCDKTCFTKGALKAHEKACKWLKPTCGMCLLPFRSLAHLHGHQSSGMCHSARVELVLVQDPANPPAPPPRPRELERLADHLETPTPPRDEGIMACFVECYVDLDDDVAETPPEKRKKVSIPVTDDDVASECEAYWSYLYKTLKGRGATMEVSDNTLKDHAAFFRSTIKHLMETLDTRSTNQVFGNLNDIDVITSLIEQHTLAQRGNTPPSATQKKENMRKLKLIYEYRDATRHVSIPAEVVEHMTIVDAKLTIELRKEAQEAHIRRETVGCEDVFGIATSGQASFSERQELRSKLHGQLERELTADAVFLADDIRFMFLCVLSEALLPSRKEAMQYLQHAFPNMPSTTEIPAKDRYFLFFRKDRGAYAITQLQNKINRNLALEVPPELTRVVELFLTVSGQGPIFPRGTNKNKALADTQFRNLEVAGYQSHGLEACVQTQRHAVTNHIITITTNAMKESYAKGMCTSISCMYGTRSTTTTSSGAGRRAYGTSYTDVAQAFPAAQHHRHMVFKEPFAPLFIMPVKTFREAPATHEVCKIIAVDATIVMAVVLVLAKDQLHYSMPLENTARLVHVPIGMATRTPLCGTNAPKYDQHGYIIPGRVFNEIVQLQEPVTRTVIKNELATKMVLAQGQLVCYKGSVAEVRAPISQGGGIPILVYSAVPGDANAWVLGYATKVVVVPRAALKVVVDWDVSNGHVTVRT